MVVTDIGGPALGFLHRFGYAAHRGRVLEAMDEVTGEVRVGQDRQMMVDPRHAQPGIIQLLVAGRLESCFQDRSAFFGKARQMFLADEGRKAIYLEPGMVRKRGLCKAKCVAVTVQEAQGKWLGPLPCTTKAKGGGRSRQ